MGHPKSLASPSGSAINHARQCLLCLVSCRACPCRDAAPLPLPSPATASSPARPRRQQPPLQCPCPRRSCPASAVERRSPPPPFCTRRVASCRHILAIAGRGLLPHAATPAATTAAVLSPPAVARRLSSALTPLPLSVPLWRRLRLDAALRPSPAPPLLRCRSPPGRHPSSCSCPRRRGT